MSEREVSKVISGKIFSADFIADTITIKIDGDYVISGGNYVVLPESEYIDLLKFRSDSEIRNHDIGNKMRKIIQISETERTLTALCDDGTIWYISTSNNLLNEWNRMLPDIPQEELKDVSDNKDIL